CKPVQPDNLLALITEILDKNDNEQEFYRGESPKAHEMYRLIEMIACADISVLLRGASGTGKEHIAAEIHARSHRKNKPYLAIDCGAISDELAASEFFGHQKGAFTGAESDKVGLFRAVNGGTLFLDEIGNLSYKTQMLLLRALQEKRCKPVGSTKEYSFDIRLVAATNENLEKAIGEGRFREDLFHRLNEFTLRIPTLAECREDILPLAYFFLKLTCAKAHKSFRGFDRLAEAALLEYPWPGNIRELKNVIGRAVLICQEQWISVSDLNLEISLPKEEETQWTEEEKEKALLLQTLEKTGDNRSKAVRLLNVSRTTLYEKLRKYHIID
ncbi:sigma-54 dependent transcriptional regulator, partial [Bacteroides ovatus]